MPPKTSKTQPKIKTFCKETVRKTRGKHNSAPGSAMPDIEEEEEFLNSEEPLADDVSLKDVIQKINEIGRRMETIEHVVFNSETGLHPRMATQEATAETTQGKLLFLTKECKIVKQDMGVVKGLIQRQATQIEVLDSKVVDLTSRSMAKNVVISGIIESKSENCVKAVQNFLKDELNVNADECEDFKIKVAHRIGMAKRGASRPMVARVSQALKQAIFNNIEDLVGRKNRNGETFYLNFQQPEAKVEAKRNAKALLRKFQGKYKSAKVEIKGDKVYVNNEWQRLPVQAPQPRDLYYDAAEQREMSKIKLIYTKPEDVRSSSFWAAAVRADTTLEVQRAYNKIRQESPSVNHIALGYVAKHNGEEISGLVDDGEVGAAHKILRAVRDTKEVGIAVFVARKYGGEHLGSQRFDIIDRLARAAIIQLKQFTASPKPVPHRSTSASPTGSPVFEDTVVKQVAV